MNTQSDPDQRSPALVRVGLGHPVVTVDRMTSAVREIREFAKALGTFPPADNYYPGVRRVIGEDDGEAWSYVDRMLSDAASYIAGAFDCDGFDLIEASFSIVTTAPHLLSPPQRAPHFDGTDPDLIAMLHYLAPAPGSATAYYRHRATGIELIDDANLATYVSAARIEKADGYVQGSNAHYEELHRIEAEPDRLLIYQGALLHSGIIPPTLTLDPDPLLGRLTANYFLRLTR